ncbi:SusC/RagA family TonB-linked outer membrane protein [Flavobacterium sp. 9AF]|uniref:SusC/RagA family TonB-linked outer membrane protein n=1 Tax=Flavobacterium sp. 9AF TaxID=2653142 RepID=UPI0012F29995|nr:SusC/RagA family TonB-linked outer membrane protein [Flavobacterium sp. 9AF]VXC40823.1 SusC/RagA family TonB-linked outer membrane protein [Flavobacterium sp. 9AF]
MRSKFKWIFALLVAFTMQFSFAQEKTVTGVVSDALGPLAGANVIVKGTNKGTTTDFNGAFTIKASQGDIVVVSYVGMEDSLFTVGAASSYNVLLKQGIELKEVVVVQGYDRTKTKATTTSASTIVSTETIENRQNASVLASLQGTAPGLTLISSSGSPGSAKFDGFIRGASSINGNTDPLLVIDGIPSTSNQFRNLNQNEIESVTVLRDAAGTSIYGNKGANGVILITTKNAKFETGIKFTYDVVTGFNTLPKNKYNLANAKEALTIEKLRGIGLGASMTDAEIAAYTTETDWLNEFFNVDVLTQHNLGVSVGGKNISSQTTLGYFKQGGLVPTTDFQRFSFRNNINGKSDNDRFNYDVQVALGYSKRNQLDQETNGNIDNNSIQNPLHGALTGLPYLPTSPYATGAELFAGIGTDFSGANDTYVLQDILREGSLPSTFTDKTAILNLGASYKLTPSLTVRNRSGIDFKQYGRLFARAPTSYLAIVVASSRGEQFGGFEDQSTFNDLTFTNISSINYNKIFKEKHNLSLGAFMEYTKAHYEGHGSRQNGLNPLNYVPGAGTGYVAFNPSTPNSYISTVNGAKLTGGTLSVFGTLDYEYLEKYGFSGVLRRDGTYRFSEDNRWGTFWSVSGRWNIDKEDFMEGSTFDMLKLRASYGTNGNQNISAANYGFPSLLTSNNLIRELAASGTGYNNIPGSLLYGQFANTPVQWEKISQANIGLDFIILNNKIEGNLDVYRKTTTNLFNSIPNSASVGFGYTIAGNNGELRNDGIELLLKYNIVRKDDFKFSVFANGAYNKNEVLQLAETDQSGVSNLRQVGNILNEWNLIPYVGVNQANGNLLYLDRNGNLTETPDEARDRRATGKSNLPKYQGGFGFNLDYKGFYLNTLFSYMVDVWRIDNQFRWASNPAFIGSENVTADFLNQWTPSNANSDVPSLQATNNNVFIGSDRFLYDSSFLRLKNVNLGFNFSKKLLNNSPISSLRVYVQGENLLTWTKWRGFDPEAITASSVTNFPNPRTISFGTSIGF